MTRRFWKCLLVLPDETLLAVETVILEQNGTHNQLMTKGIFIVGSLHHKQHARANVERHPIHFTYFMFISGESGLG